MGIFRTIHVHNTTTAAPYPQTITEKRAPTDESVRLLKEMEEAAIDKILQSYRFENNLIEGILVVFQLSAETFDKIAYIRFSLNGKKFSFKVPIRMDMAHFQATTALEMFAKAVRDAIFENLMPEIGKELERSGGVRGL